MLNVRVSLSSDILAKQMIKIFSIISVKFCYPFIKLIHLWRPSEFHSIMKAKAFFAVQSF